MVNAKILNVQHVGKYKVGDDDADDADAADDEDDADDKNDEGGPVFCC